MTRKHNPPQPLRMLFADDQGRFREHAKLLMAAGTWDRSLPAEEIATPIPLPKGAQVVFLPGRRPVGIDPASGKPLGGRGERSHAVAAVLPPGFLRLALPAYQTSATAPALPLRAYTAIGLQGERLMVLATRADPRKHWDPARFVLSDLDRRIARVLKQAPKNRLLRQLQHCAMAYSCCTAKNVFLHTFEGALPVAPRCNAGCLGCISFQSGSGVASPQERLLSPPPVEDIVSVATLHLKRARPGMVSFGQGCEGEPLTEASRVIEAIRRIRERTSLGSIHLNTNGSFPERVAALAKAGLNSIRVSLLSARPAAFRDYHRGSFGLECVEDFVSRAVSRGLYAAINLLVFPGFTDRPGEIEALLAFLGRTRAQMVQLRNLDLDPDWFIENNSPAHGDPVGLPTFLRTLKQRLPRLAIGCFNRFREEYECSDSDPVAARRRHKPTRREFLIS